jgi:hypothetical protein
MERATANVDTNRTGFASYQIGVVFVADVAVFSDGSARSYNSKEYYDENPTTATTSSSRCRATIIARQ